MSDFAQDIFQSMSIIAQQTVKKANFDKTIQATIVSCVDPTIGKYKVSYQDGSWYAFSNNINTKYTAGASVYILIPGGDMNSTKTILGTTKQLGINYISTVEDIDKYSTNGNNVLTDSSTHALCSYNTKTIVLYDSTNTANSNSIKIDTNAADTYIKSSSSFIVTATVRTALPIQQRYNGNYGISFYLQFKDKAQQANVTRVYTFDVDTMEGNPYFLVNATSQRKIFEIDGANFVKILKIEVFVKDFPHQTQEKSNDIFISNISFTGATELTNQELNGTSLQLIARNGYIFTSDSQDTEERPIEAQVRVLGKPIDNASQSLPFYWFVQDISVTTRSQYYHKYGGQGWKCLNSYKTVSTNPTVVDFNPSSYIYKVKKSDATIKQTKYKCVAVYDGTVISKEFVIINQGAKYDITITSDKGTQFASDNGYPTLTCKVSGSIVTNPTFVWSETTNVGTYIPLTDQTTDYNNYQSKITQRDNLKTGFDNGTKLKNAYYQGTVKNITQYNNLVSEIKTLDKKQYVTKNKIVHLNVKNITNFSTFSCSVFNANSALIGTASITIVNKGSDGGYTLIINDGTQTFNYDENGVSPCNDANEKPFVIPALTFTVFDMKGNEIQENIIKNSAVEWIVPIENTMLINQDSGTLNSDGISKTVTGKRTLTYKINNKYYINKNNNDIQLKVNYEGYTLTAKTNFSFVKQGENGTNGTGFVARIVPVNSSNVVVSEYPYMYTQNGTTYTKGNFSSLKAQLWHNGQLIFNSNQGGDSTEGKGVIIVWSILQNKYSSSLKDATCLQINTNNGSLTGTSSSANLKTLYTQLSKTTNKDNNVIYKHTPANIVKLMLVYDGITYYATLPIICGYMPNFSNYRCTLQKNTGFQYVTYAQDGRQPLYDNREPFTFKVNAMINSTLEDISTSTVSNYSPSYSFGYLGTIYETKNISKCHLISAKKPTNPAPKKNQAYVKPTDSYDGLSVTNSVYCIAKVGSNVMFLVVPVHFMLNRYGHAALNEWDGNSISIDEKGGVILAPQVGAGSKKEGDNSFTGILMGEVKRSSSNQIETGLFGYANGVRTIFLDAETGKAEFGASGEGQIIINPRNEENKYEAIIKSGNYQKASASSTGGGMQINLSKPTIEFGTKNFVVNEKGHLTAKGGGNIAGWMFDDQHFWKPASASSPKWDAGENVLLSSSDFSRSINQIPSTDITNLRLALGQKFAVTADGTLYAGDAILGTGKKARIYLGKSRDPDIKEEERPSAIYSSKWYFKEDYPGFYLGTDGIALGRYDKNSKTSAFQVTADGQMTARNGYIGNGKSGFRITSTALYNNKSSFDTAIAGVYIGTNGISLGYNEQDRVTPFSVSKYGYLIASTGEIGGWNLTPNKLYKSGNFNNSIAGIGSFNSNNSIAFVAGASSENFSAWTEAPFSVTYGGKLYATGATISGDVTAETGNIAGWHIGKYSIWREVSDQTLPGYLVISNNGKIYTYTFEEKQFYNKDYIYIGARGISLSDKFKVDRQGNLTANDVDIQGEIKLDTGRIGGEKGWTISSNVIQNGQQNQEDYYYLSNALSQYNKSFYLDNETVHYNDWKLMIGKSFGVRGQGELYAKNAHMASSTFSGKITATEGQIGGLALKSGILYGGPNSQIERGVVDVNSKKITIAGYNDSFHYEENKNITFQRNRTVNSKTETISNLKFAIGSQFLVDSNGKLYAQDADIVGKINVTKGATVGPWNVTDTSIWCGSDKFGETNGMYFGTSGISVSTAFSVTNEGVANFTGTINANGGTIGGSDGWSINTNQITHGTIGQTDSIFLSTENTTSNKTVANHSDNDWRFTIGSHFGIRKNGSMYCRNATLNNASLTNGNLTLTTTNTKMIFSDGKISVQGKDPNDSLSPIHQMGIIRFEDLQYNKDPFVTTPDEQSIKGAGINIDGEDIISLTCKKLVVKTKERLSSHTELQQPYEGITGEYEIYKKSDRYAVSLAFINGICVGFSKYVMSSS